MAPERLWVPADVASEQYVESMSCCKCSPRRERYVIADRTTMCLSLQHLSIMALQTVIECLKMACTGVLPPNAKSGQLFIHDPKVSLATQRPHASLIRVKVSCSAMHHVTGGWGVRGQSADQAPLQNCLRAASGYHPLLPGNGRWLLLVKMLLRLRALNAVYKSPTRGWPLSKRPQ